MSAPTRIAHYQLLAPIHRDGTTEIYRARDLRLDREVAVKILRPEEASRPAALDRFRREARIASLVTHPHICAVHDSGEESGQPFLVCELLDGQALDEMISGTPLPIDRLLDIGIQLTDALAAAHRRSVVHGNLKPSNVFITRDGHVKLLELGAFSAARPAAGVAPENDSASRTTSIEMPVSPVRTGEFFHSYLSPEQLDGRGADEQGDIFAAGALLYEMATGKRAFSGDTPAEIARAIAQSTPAMPRSLNPALPATLEPVIMRALARDPVKRQVNAGQLLEELRTARRALDQPATAIGRWTFRRPRLIAGVAGVVLLAALALTGYSRGWWRIGSVPVTERSSVLVSHVANGTGDPDFDDTLREALSVYLAQSPYLDVVSDERIRGALERMGRDKDTRMTHDVAAEVCQRLGLDAMLEGSVAAVGRATVVSLVATDCASGDTIVRQQSEVERKEDVLRALGTLTATVRRDLGESAASLNRHNVPIEEATTPSLNALKAYTEAASRRASGEETAAIPFLERAIALDPRFALAYTTLSAIYGGLGETSRSEALAELAYENREHVSEREKFFIAYQYHDRFTGDQLKARERLEVWKGTYTRDYRPANALAVLLLRLGDFDQAAVEAQEALRRNPDHSFPYSNLAYAYRGAGRYAEARKIAEQSMARNTPTVPTRRLLYQIAEIQGDSAAIATQLQWAASNPRGFDIVGARAQVEAFRGRMTDARRLYRETIDAATAGGFGQVASGYASQAALTEALYGYEREALGQAREVAKRATALEPQLRAAAALALAGAPDEADAIVRRLRGVRPDDTLLHAAYLPPAESAILLRRGDAAGAVAMLRAGTPYEKGFVAALVPAYLRGIARLRAGAVQEGIEDFRSILRSRGTDPFSPLIPLAQLNLARALARAGAVAESRQTYAALLQSWPDADADLPPLIEARREMSQQP